MALIYNNDFLLELAYMMGERAVNATTTAPRTNFIQDALQDAYKAYPWRFARANATLIVDNGLATLPTNYDDSHIAYAKFDNGGVADDVHLIDPDDEDEVQDGSRLAWVESIGDGDRYVIKLRDSDVSILRFRYQKLPPVLSTPSVGTPYPNKATIALGARRYVKLGQNPDADISQDQKIFERELAKDIAAHQVPAPRKSRRTRHDRTGRYTGDF